MNYSKVAAWGGMGISIAGLAMGVTSHSLTLPSGILFGVGLILVGSTITWRRYAGILRFLGILALGLFILDATLFASDRFDTLSLSIGGVAVLLLLYPVAERWLRFASLLLGFSGLACALGLLFLLGYIVPNLTYDPVKPVELPALTPATPAQAAAYDQWVQLVPKSGSSSGSAVDYERFMAAAKKVPDLSPQNAFFNPETRAQIQKQLPECEPYLDRVWSFRSTHVPVPAEISPTMEVPSFRVLRRAVVWELAAIGELADSGNPAAAEARYLRLLQAHLNAFAGSRVLVDHLVTLAFAQITLEFLAKESPNFFRDPASASFLRLHELLEKMPDAIAHSGVEACLGEQVGFQRFLAQLKQGGAAESDGKSRSESGKHRNSLTFGNRFLRWPFYNDCETRALQSQRIRWMIEPLEKPEQLEDCNRKLAALRTEVGIPGIWNPVGRNLLFVVVNKGERVAWRTLFAQSLAGATATAVSARANGPRIAARTDPLTGKPYDVQYSEAGIRVNYAVGVALPEYLFLNDREKTVVLK